MVFLQCLVNSSLPMGPIFGWALMRGHTAWPCTGLDAGVAPVHGDAYVELANDAVAVIRRFGIVVGIVLDQQPFVSQLPLKRCCSAVVCFSWHRVAFLLIWI